MPNLRFYVLVFKSPKKHQILTRDPCFLQMSHTNRAAVERDNDSLFLSDPCHSLAYSATHKLMLWRLDVCDSQFGRYNY